jgi:hypothetical protein
MWDFKVIIGRFLILGRACAAVAVERISIINGQIIFISLLVKPFVEKTDISVITAFVVNLLYFDYLSLAPLLEVQFGIDTAHV